MVKLKQFLMKSKDVEKDSYVWNLFGSFLMAFQSVIMLMVLTRTLGLQDAGIFTIAYANANLFLTIGKYGMRYFQVSDAKMRFSFGEYRCSRIITTTAMLCACVAYVLYAGWRNSYSSTKSWVIIWMCCFKAVDSIEDVFHGFCQQNGRLDVASKALTMRMVFSILAFIGSIWIGISLLFSLIITTVVSLSFWIIFTVCMTEFLGRGERKIDGKNLCLLLKNCFLKLIIYQKI